MPLNASGQISIGGSTVGESINLQIGRLAAATSNLNETLVRTCADVPSGQISLSNFYGKPLFGRIWKYTDISIYGAGFVYFCYDMDCSANGQILYIAGGEFLVKSTDYGETFSLLLTSPNKPSCWECVSISSNGSIILAAPSNVDYLYISKDGGASFAQTLVQREWKRVEISDDGFRMFAYCSNNGIYTSSNMGTNWTSRTSPVANGNTFIYSAASSNTQYIMLSTIWYPISNTYVSTNYGNTWTKKAVTDKGGIYWANPQGVTISSNGMIMYIVCDSGEIYKSTNFGSTFSYDADFDSWAPMKPSCDGTGKKVIVGNSNGGDYIFVSEDGFDSNATIRIGGNISGGMDGGVHISQDGNYAYIVGIYGDFYKLIP